MIITFILIYSQAINIFRSLIKYLVDYGFLCTEMKMTHNYILKKVISNFHCYLGIKKLSLVSWGSNFHCYLDSKPSNNYLMINEITL